MNALKLAYSKLVFAVAVAAVTFAVDVRAQSVPANPLGITRLTVGTADSSIQSAFALNPPSRVQVPFYEWVILQAPAGVWSTYQWTKNGTPIPGATGSAFGILLATAGDSGSYNLTGTLLPNIAPTIVGTAIQLDVAPTGKLLNTSALVDLAPNGSATAGFVIPTQQGGGTATVLIRAVGPSLSAFGIQNPASSPHLRLFNAHGQDITTAILTLAPNWPATFALAGAFPLTGGEQPITAYDVAGLAPGAYTVQVTDDSNKGGTVLIEVYVMPNAIYTTGPT